MSALIFSLTCIFEKLKKREVGGQVREVLGLEVATLTGQVCLPERKRLALLALVQLVLSFVDVHGAITVDALASLVGKLQDASQGCVGADYFLFALREPLRLLMHLLPRKRDRCHFVVAFAFFPRQRLEFEAWVACLSDVTSFQYHISDAGKFFVWKWTPAFHECALPLGLFTAATDASKLGGGIAFDGTRISHMWSDGERRLHINVLEALMPVQWVKQCGPQLRGCRGVLWVDNMTALCALNKGKSKNKLIAAAAREFKYLCMLYAIQVWVSHIPTLKNVEADHISRGVLGRRIADWSFSNKIMSK